MKNVIMSLCLALLLAGCGVQWFPAVNNTPAAAETVTASITGGPFTLVGVSTATNKIPITLTGTGSSSKGSAVSYQWSVTSANSANATFGAATSPTTSFSATAAGTYEVQLKVTSTTDTTKSATAPTTVTVSVPTETVTALAGDPATIRTVSGTGTTLPLHGEGTSSTGGALTYQWTVTSANATSATLGTPTAKDATFSASALGDYTVQFKVSSATTPTISDTVTFTVRVQAPPAAESVTTSITNTTPTVNGLTVSNAIVLNGTAVFAIGPGTVSWTASGANAASAHFGSAATAVTTFWADAPGTYNVTLTATSQNDVTKTSTSTATITVVDDTVLGGKASYFPLTPTVASGSPRTWTYKFINSQNQDVVTVGSGTQTLSHQQTLNQTISTFNTQYKADVNGVLLTAIVTELTTSTYAPGLPIFPKSTTPGNSEPTTYTVTVAGATNTHTVTLTVVGVEPVTLTELGQTFNNALHIQATGIPSGEGSLKADAWYVPGVGLVKDSEKELTFYTK